jgi:hypothetical protein
VWAARPLVVVDDADDRLLLWIPRGTVRKVPVTPLSRDDPADRSQRAIENLAREDWAYGEHVWDVSCLWILTPGAWHGVWVSWDPSGRHHGWYVNLQRPFTRTPIGIEAMDLALDVVVEPDRTWRWKDEEEFEKLVDRSIFDSATASRVREEAETVIGRIEDAQAPFCEPWPSWRPDPRWPIPSLPPGWDAADLRVGGRHPTPVREDRRLVE